MARPKTDEATLKAIFESIVAGKKSKQIAEELDFKVSVSLIADMRNGWAHTELGKTYGVEPKMRKPKAPKAEPEADVAYVSEVEFEHEKFGDETIEG